MHTQAIVPHVKFTLISLEIHVRHNWLCMSWLYGTPTNINGSNARHSAKKQTTDPGSVTIMVQQEGPELHYVLQDIPSHCKSSGPPTIY